MSRAMVKYYNDYLQLFMPNGDIIPEQTNLIIENSVGDRKQATVTVTLVADISKISEPITANQSELVKELEEKLYVAKKDAVFWEREYINKQNNESLKFKKLTYLLLILFLATACKLYTLI